MKSLLLALVTYYRRHISVHLPPRCKYYPTCSTYALTCLQRHGAAKGTLLSAWRWVRCNPLSDGGVDYPPLAGQWVSAPYHQMSDAELASYWAALDGCTQLDNPGSRGENRASSQDDFDRVGQPQARKGI